MTFRQKSRSGQWMLWGAAALAGIVAYVVVSVFVNGAVTWDLMAPSAQRVLLPVLALVGLFAWETRWDGVTRADAESRDEAAETGPAANGAAVRDERPRVEVRPQARTAPVRTQPAPGVRPPPSVARPAYVPHAAAVPRAAQAEPPADEPSPEAQYAQARVMRHQPIPDFASDREYLKLLGRSAVRGYPRAMAKLGEYAMRRGAWVEAYFWTWKAHRGGMRHLAATLLKIRRHWVMDGYPNQRSNVNALFTMEFGSIGRALLSVDSGHGAHAAREFLRQYFPEGLAK